MRPARLLLAIGTIAALSLAGVMSAQQAKPAMPMQIEKVKDGLYLIRGPFNRCAPNGCSGGCGDDGLLHEAGDVAVRVTPEGLILVDDKYQDNVADILEKVKSISSLPIKYSSIRTTTPTTPAATRRSSTRPRSSRTATCAKTFCATSSRALRG